MILAVTAAIGYLCGGLAGAAVGVLVGFGIVIIAAVVEELE